MVNFVLTVLKAHEIQDLGHRALILLNNGRIASQQLLQVVLLLLQLLQDHERSQLVQPRHAHSDHACVCLARRWVSTRKVRLVQILGNLKRLINLIFYLRLVPLFESVDIFESLVNYAPTGCQFLLILVLQRTTLHKIPLAAK